MTNPVVVAPVQPAVVQPAPVVVVPALVEKKVEEKVEKPIENLSIPPSLKKKAQQVAEIMGGAFSDYIDDILELPCKATV